MVTCTDTKREVPMLKRLTDRTTTLGYEGVILRTGLGLSFLMSSYTFSRNYIPSYLSSGDSSYLAVAIISTTGILASILLLTGYLTRLWAITITMLALLWVAIYIAKGNAIHCIYVLIIDLSQYYSWQTYYIGTSLALFIWGGGRCSSFKKDCHNNGTEIIANYTECRNTDNKRTELFPTVLRLTIAVDASLYLFDRIYNLFIMHFTEPISLVAAILTAFIITGLYTRITSAALIIYYIIMYIIDSMAFGSWLELIYLRTIVILSLLAVLVIRGPGRYSVDRWLAGKRAAKSSM